MASCGRRSCPELKFVVRTVRGAGGMSRQSLRGVSPDSSRAPRWQDHSSRVIFKIAGRCSASDSDLDSEAWV